MYKIGLSESKQHTQIMLRKKLQFFAICNDGRFFLTNISSIMMPKEGVKSKF